MTADRRNGLFLWGAAAVALAVDQLSKWWVLHHLPRHETVDVFPALRALFSFTRLNNTGVAFGMFPQLGDLFLVLTAVIVVALIIFHRRLGLVGWVAHLALGLQIGGALGNWVDRVVHGSVVDFIDVNFWPLHDWPVFNLADTAIVVGVTLLIITTWSQEQQGVETGVETPRESLSDA
ncbi:MAG: signal peptidase II [Anaerolineae bacterium]